MSDEMRKLEAKWVNRNGWPKWLQWVQIRGIRGWEGQRVEFDFPIVAIAGENGSGKSTILQCAACAYQSQTHETWYPSEFFPETAWDRSQDIRIEFSYKQGVGAQPVESSIRKPTTRWLGQPSRPERQVYYIGLDRLQPVSTRVGYARIAKTKHTEASATNFDEEQIKRLSFIMGEDYDSAKLALSNIDSSRKIPVLSNNGVVYSGYHHAMGELTAAELISNEINKYSLLIIDEIESSLHVRTQRRMIRDLARIAREKECQVIISTHSPAVLEELPISARTYILRTNSSRSIVVGVTPQFAMTKMDDKDHPDTELYIEDERAGAWLSEILSKYAPDMVMRTKIIPYGKANLGIALGQLVKEQRLPRPTVVILDGDQDLSDGCCKMPGDDAPERVVFKKLKENNWGGLPERIIREYADVADACSRAMTLQNHHEWVRSAANTLRYPPDTLWISMCAEWVKNSEASEVAALVEYIQSVADAGRN